MNKAYQYIDEVIKERGYAPSVMDITNRQFRTEEKLKRQVFAKKQQKY